jgi:indole-3-glycerol phosphate synthase
VGTYLSEILAAHRALVAADRRDLDHLIAEAAGRPAPRGFRAALAEGATRGLGVIAEIKRRSPSRGDLALGLDPAALGTAYAAGGARALSVLTDERFFGGSASDLARARAAVSLPVLRKDFTLGPADVADARLMGADAVLLIAAALAPTELVELGALARDLGLDALVEVHDEAELESALAAGASLVGVNQRDLTTFRVDGQRAARLARSLPASVVAVAESGVGGREDAARLADAGYAAVLVGEHLVTAPDPTAAVSALGGLAVNRPLGAGTARR